MATREDVGREIADLLSARIVDTNLRVVVVHLRRLAEEERDEPERRAALRDAVVDVERVRRNLERAL